MSVLEEDNHSGLPALLIDFSKADGQAVGPGAELETVFD
jgi:hypothetical protein